MWVNWCGRPPKSFPRAAASRRNGSLMSLKAISLNTYKRYFLSIVPTTNRTDVYVATETKRQGQIPCHMAKVLLAAQGSIAYSGCSTCSVAALAFASILMYYLSVSKLPVALFHCRLVPVATVATPLETSIGSGLLNHDTTACMTVDEPMTNDDDNAHTLPINQPSDRVMT
jgi:hypothetical protein